MIYQKLLMGSNPYFVSVGGSSPFETHRHHEIELSFCIKGSYDIICENHRYSLNTGDLAVISPMAKHEIPGGEFTCKKLTIEIGYTLLGDFFKIFNTLEENCIIFKSSEDSSETYKELTKLLYETAELNYNRRPYGELLIKGNLYKIGAHLLTLCAGDGIKFNNPKKTSDIKKIDKALEKIHNSYFEQLNIEEISEFCGYSKSNFCKIFKNITGETFHNMLNSYRIEVSCMLLRETNNSIERIAEETGFADSKSFCRTFKSFMGISARQYRKNL